jgi:hypothetical protein
LRVQKVEYWKLNTIDKLWIKSFLDFEMILENENREKLRILNLKFYKRIKKERYSKSKEFPSKRGKSVIDKKIFGMYKINWLKYSRPQYSQKRNWENESKESWSSSWRSCELVLGNCKRGTAREMED